MRSMTCVLMLALAGCATRVDPAESAPASADAHARVAAILAATPLVDGHNDLVIHYHACKQGCPRGLDAYDIGARQDGHTDLPRWREGGVGAQLLNAGWLESEVGLDGTLKGLAFVRAMVARYPDRMALARTAAEIRAIHASGRLAILLALEHPDRIGTDEAQVRRLAAEGLRSEILAYDEPTALADGHAGPAKHGGLSPLGVRMVGWMQRAGILVDLSHASADTARDVLDVAVAPVIFSHSNAAAITDGSRNVPDDVLRRLPANGGLVMVSFVPEFSSTAFADWYGAGDREWQRLLALHAGNREAAGPAMDAWEQANPKPAVGIDDVVAHIEHIRDVAGVDHIGLGSDFDGIDFTVQGLEDVSKFPALLEALAQRGWSDADLAKLAGENFLRVLDTADAAVTPYVAGAAASPATPSPAPAPRADYAAWARKNPDGRWTAAAEAAVAASGLAGVVPTDIERFCPGYAGADVAGRRQFWVGLLSAVARPESNFKPETKYEESFADAQGHRVVSRGLLQISIESANQRKYGCGIARAEDLHDPATNLACGVKILDAWVQSDRAIANYGAGAPRGGGRYWSTLRERNGHLPELTGFTRRLGVCTVG